MCGGTAISNFTAMVTGRGNIKTYLHKYKIIQNPMFPCKQGEQSVDHILYDYKLYDQGRDKLKAAVIRLGSWPVIKVKFGIKYFKKTLKVFTDNILLNKE
jgi:hypothetical protein